MSYSEPDDSPRTTSVSVIVLVIIAFGMGLMMGFGGLLAVSVGSGSLPLWLPLVAFTPAPLCFGLATWAITTMAKGRIGRAKCIALAAVLVLPLVMLLITILEP